MITCEHIIALAQEMGVTVEVGPSDSPCWIVTSGKAVPLSLEDMVSCVGSYQPEEVAEHLGVPDSFSDLHTGSGPNGTHSCQQPNDLQNVSGDSPALPRFAHPLRIHVKDLSFSVNHTAVMMA